jgi:hypothetical protein
VVGFAVAEKGEGELGVGGYAFEDCTVRGEGWVSDLVGKRGIGWVQKEAGKTHFRGSNSFCQLGMVRFSQSKPLERIGSPKKTAPIRKDMDFTRR